MQTDILIIGSGFGGSVSAMRLAEKGWRVGVLEMGRRLTRDDFEAVISMLTVGVFGSSARMRRLSCERRSSSCIAVLVMPYAGLSGNAPEACLRLSSSCGMW
mgnify:CR=1 FL=1